MGRSLSEQDRLETLSLTSLLAGAIGDSLGADIEFLELEEIRDMFPQGPNRLSRTASRAPGWFTDDTQMTLWTAEGLIHAFRDTPSGVPATRVVVEAVHEALLLWLQTQNCDLPLDVRLASPLLDDRRMWFRAAPGTTCLSSLRRATLIGAPAQNDSKGCGAIMRVAPVALALPHARVWAVALKTAALTHGHASGQIAAAAWAGILSDVLHGIDPDMAIQSALAHCRREEFGDAGGETERAILAALQAPSNGTAETVETLGQGWVAEEALSIALYAVLACGGSFERGLQIAVSHSGDSDSTGAIAGNLLGLLYPDQVSDHRWSREIGGRDLIARSAKGLAELAHR